RETLEEANARVEIGPLYAMYNIPHINQVYILFRARLLDLDFSAGSESLEVALFSEAAIPWEELAFSSVRNTLRHFFEDRRKGEFALHFGDITLPLDEKKGADQNQRPLPLPPLPLAGED
ncbi:MAG: hypothetical protein Q8J61_01465, partial [Sulfuricella sp.]|nr:hypothetical protein [Sulfuricella sp.]